MSSCFFFSCFFLCLSCLTLSSRTFLFFLFFLTNQTAVEWRLKTGTGSRGITFTVPSIVLFFFLCNLTIRTTTSNQSGAESRGVVIQTDGVESIAFQTVSVQYHLLYYEFPVSGTACTHSTRCVSCLFSFSVSCLLCMLPLLPIDAGLVTIIMAVSVVCCSLRVRKTSQISPVLKLARLSAVYIVQIQHYYVCFVCLRCF